MIRVRIRAAIPQEMPVSLRFRCQFCDVPPDPLTHVSLVTAMRHTTFGEYQDALPGRWLIFHGRGLLGPPRYACEAHRATSSPTCARTTARSAPRSGAARPIPPASRTPTWTTPGGSRPPAGRAGPKPRPALTARPRSPQPTRSRAVINADPGGCAVRGSGPGTSVGKAKAHNRRARDVCSGAGSPGPHTARAQTSTQTTKGAATAAPFATYNWTLGPGRMFCVPVGPIRLPAQGWPGLDSLGGASLSGLAAGHLQGPART